ncbi:pilus biosynthesis protein CpaE [Kocuria varians]|uniref:Pilus biosynthesis protein CpaE n=1 Tax=Kocuria varians TaxID=1272 RepID=A0A4Y4D5W1_KOCVA|nr:AAA family ATPase [Kocuria varians]GEC99084.1 pilus biosynthesis protein CpaE [Kocuria varians]
MSTSLATLGISTWELVDRVERLHGEVTVVRRCLELSELLACSHTGMADAALVAEGAEDLTASLLEQLADNGVRVLVVEGHDDARLARLGVPSISASATGAEVVRAVREAIGSSTITSGDSGADHTAGAGPDASGVVPFAEPGRRIRGAGQNSPETGRKSHSGPGHEVDSPEPATAGVSVSPADPADEGWQPDAGAAATSGAEEVSRAPRGIVAVWGPAGSPGRTVTAVNLAAEAALSGTRVLLVDADTCAASVAASLGMLDEAAGLAQACRLADQGRMDDSGLRRCVTAVSVAGASMDVLTGITRYDRWPEIRGSALGIVLERARGDYDLVVVDTAFSLESDEEISSDFLAPRRNAAALVAVSEADTVVALGAADALGVPRLVKALPDLLDAAPGARPVVVMNKLRAAAAGRSAAAAVQEAWERFSPGHPVVHTLSWDPGSCDDALLAGAVLAETAPRSVLRSELRDLVRLLARPEGRGPAEPVGAAAGGTRLGRRMGAWLRRG